ncbi:MAG: pirin family protein [Candidatus Nanopelagicales bacterium]
MSVQVFDPHEAVVGSFSVRRALPRRSLRTVGPWCFADQMGPAEVTVTTGLDVGPHPHIGLQTVTWLMQGTALHKDSLGSEQLISPGQLNLMSAGHGIVHAEEATGAYRGTLHGVQLWVAQADGANDGERDGPPGFEHHAELPAIDSAVGTFTVLAGSFAGVQSPAGFAPGLAGVDAVLRAGRSQWPLRADFEHAVIALDGEILVGDSVARPGQLAYLGTGRSEIGIEARDRARLLLLGGLPFTGPLVMWWNFVGRSREEIVAARRQWLEADGRFGEVASRLARIPAPELLWRVRPAG